MGDALVALGGALLAAGLLARLGRRVGLPTIPFFMAAGILLGPNTPGIVLLDEPEDLALLAALGLILLLFHLGLEFSLGRPAGRRAPACWRRGRSTWCSTWAAVWPSASPSAGARARPSCWPGAVGISSSAIVTKLLVELRRLANPESRLILGIIVVEDVFLALYLAFLQPVIGGAEGAGEAIREFLTAFAFLVALAAVARYGAQWVGRLVESPDDELLTVSFLGLAVLVAGVSEELGVSDAIGAFMIGLILAESTVAPRIERLVLPLRDAFAAIFFFAFGLTIDPGEASDVAVPVAAAVVLTLVLNVLAGGLASRMHGFGPAEAANVSLTILGRGEFSLILATLAAAAGLDPRIGPFVALYVLILAIGGPLLAANSAPARPPPPCSPPTGRIAHDPCAHDRTPPSPERRAFPARVTALVVAAVVGAAAAVMLLASLRGPSFVDELTVVNGTVYRFNVERVGDGGRERGPARRPGPGRPEPVPGGHRPGGHLGLPLRLRRGRRRLVHDRAATTSRPRGWTIDIPVSAEQRLREMGVTPSAEFL